MKILSDNELKKKNTKNLLFILRKLRPQAYSIGYCHSCCDFCGYPEKSKDEKEQDDAIKDYLQRIKAILKSREHVGKSS